MEHTAQPSRSEYQAISSAGSCVSHFELEPGSSGRPSTSGEPPCLASGGHHAGPSSSRDEMDIDSALEAVGFGRYHLLLFVYSGLVWFSDALEVMLLSFLGPAVTCEWSLTADQDSLLTSVVFLGMMFGAWFWGGVADSLGRKTAFAATAIFTASFGVASAFSHNYVSLLVFRAAVGFGLAGAPAQYTLFMEWLPPSVRGRWLILFNIWWTMGSLIEAILALLLFNSYGWRVLVGVSSIPMIFLVLLYPLVPDSPRHLLANGHAVKAVALLRHAAKVNGSDPLPKNMSLQLPPSAPHDVCQKETHGSCTCRECAAVHGKSRWQEFTHAVRQLATDTLHLFKPHLAPLTAGLLLTWFITALSYYGLVMLATQLTLPQDKIGVDQLPPAYPPGASVDPEQCMDGKLTLPHSTFNAAITASFAEMPALVYQLWIVGTTTSGRHRPAALSLHATAVSLLPLLVVAIVSETAASAGSVVVTLSLFFSRFFISSAFSFLYIFSPEVLPTRIRALGMGICNSVSRVGGLVCPFVAVGLVLRHRADLAVAIFMGSSVLAGLVIHLVGWGTHGRELDIDSDESRSDKRKAAAAGDGSSKAGEEEEEEEEERDEEVRDHVPLLPRSRSLADVPEVVVEGIYYAPPYAAPLLPSSYNPQEVPEVVVDPGHAPLLPRSGRLTELPESAGGSVGGKDAPMYTLE